MCTQIAVRFVKIARQDARLHVDVEQVLAALTSSQVLSLSAR